MTREEIKAAYERADAAMKKTKGHAWVHVLKTRCDHCRLSEKQAARGKSCSGWFTTFLDCLMTELTVQRESEQPEQALREALLKVRSYNADILAGRINYRPQDHIDVIDAALSPQTDSQEPR